jgi:hypothetical protein
MTLFKLIRGKIPDDISIYTRSVIKVAVPIYLQGSGMVGLHIRGLRGSNERCGINLAEALDILAVGIAKKFGILVFEDGVLFYRLVRPCERLTLEKYLHYDMAATKGTLFNRASVELDCQALQE